MDRNDRDAVGQRDGARVGGTLEADHRVVLRGREPHRKLALPPDEWAHLMVRCRRGGGEMNGSAEQRPMRLEPVH